MTPSTRTKPKKLTVNITSWSEGQTPRTETVDLSDLANVHASPAASSPLPSGSRLAQSDDDGQYPVPEANKFFDDETTRPTAFLDAPDLYRLALRLIDSHPEKFAHLSQARFTCLWKKEGGLHDGKITLGKTSRATGFAKYFGAVDIVIWLAADHLRHYCRRNVEAVLYHELCHVGWDADSGLITLLPHDFEGFAAEVREYGQWRYDLEVAGKAFTQLGLFMEGQQ